MTNLVKNEGNEIIYIFLIKGWIILKKTLKKLVKKYPLLKSRYYLIKSGYYKRYGDKKIITKLFKKRLGYIPDLENPITFNEKMQWLKLYWYDSNAAKLADKYSVRKYVKEKCGDEYLNQLYGVYDDVRKIDLTQLPNQFVLKVTHGSGFNVICKNKKEVNWNEKFKLIKTWMKINYYLINREWVYKDIKPNIICERYLSDTDPGGIKDYKFFCFNGVPKYIQVDSDRFIDHKRNMYDINWRRLPVDYFYSRTEELDEKPSKLEEMIEIVKKLSEGFPFVRVDLYFTQNKIYFGEMTFFPESGFGKFMPEKYDKIFGEQLILPK